MYFFINGIIQYIFVFPREKGWKGRLASAQVTGLLPFLSSPSSLLPPGGHGKS